VKRTWYISRAQAKSGLVNPDVYAVQSTDVAGIAFAKMVRQKGERVCVYMCCALSNLLTDCQLPCSECGGSTGRHEFFPILAQLTPLCSPGAGTKLVAQLTVSEMLYLTEDRLEVRVCLCFCFGGAVRCSWVCFDPLQCARSC
jgi:hypothetical protein